MITSLYSLDPERSSVLFLILARISGGSTGGGSSTGKIIDTSNTQRLFALILTDLHAENVLLEKFLVLLIDFLCAGHATKVPLNCVANFIMFYLNFLYTWAISTMGIMLYVYFEHLNNVR